MKNLKSILASVFLLVFFFSCKNEPKTEIITVETTVEKSSQKLDPNAPHETLLVLDAGTGQNAISQMTEFSKTVPVTGLALTKLDGTAKGGVIFALARQMNRPIRFIGVGEGIDDMQPFSADEFTKALFSGETE